MSSLPQGWHGVITSTPNSAGTSGSVPITIRKKWNSSMPSNMPQTKLPSYKSSNLRQQNYNINGTYRVKSPMVTSTPSTTKLPTPTKPSPVKEYKTEIEKLKKELSTIKAENSILKAKVRRVDDENLQKGRQIEKMRAEIKSLQKNESGSSRKSKESQELLLLRQKCLRLESAVKDKDLTIKRLESIKRENVECLKASSSMQKRPYQVSSAVQLKSSSKNNEKESISAKSSLSRASLSLKTEVTKLRDMIHKLEKENQDLQQQAKLHCQEIRRLKIQMKSKDKTASLQTSVSKSESLRNIKNKPIFTTLNQENLRAKSAANSFVPKQKIVKSSMSPLQAQVTTKSSVPTKNSDKKDSTGNVKISSLPNGKGKQLSRNKQTKSVKSNLPVTRTNLMKGMTKPIVEKLDTSKLLNRTVTKTSDFEHKVQEIRENIAAKKIQRSWRQHQKCLQYLPELEFQNGGKALTFIISSMKHHKLRNDKLNILVKKSQLPEAIRKDAFVETIQSISKKVWDQDVST